LDRNGVFARWQFFETEFAIRVGPHVGASTNTAATVRVDYHDLFQIDCYILDRLASLSIHDSSTHREDLGRGSDCDINVCGLSAFTDFNYPGFRCFSGIGIKGNRKRTSVPKTTIETDIIFTDRNLVTSRSYSEHSVNAPIVSLKVNRNMGSTAARIIGR